MSDPQHLGLGELGQRVQALSDPAADSRLRPYQGAPLPVGSSSNGRAMPPYEPLEDLRTAPPPAVPPTPATPASSFVSPSFQTATSYANQVPGQISGQVSAQTPLPGIQSNPAPASGAAPAWENVPPPVQSTEPAQAAQQATLPKAAPAPNAASDANAPKSGLQRAIDAIRSTLPLVQKLLPLLDGNFATAVGALMAPQTSHPPPPPPIQIDLDPLERGLAEVRNGNRELRGIVIEQVTTLKRVEDQLERVREATDRNTLEQQELVEDLRSVGSRISAFAIVGLILLAISLGLNVYFLIQLQHILR